MGNAIKYILRAFSLPTQRCFPIRSPDSASPFTFLCLRRGVSALLDVYREGTRLFSAYAEVFPRGCSQRMAPTCFSLPTQRCFCLSPMKSDQRYLFSAYAEVFPLNPRWRTEGPAFLCLRRGVSFDIAFILLWKYCFSLPTQRCFLTGGELDSTTRTFLCLRRGVSHRRCPSVPAGRFSLPTQRCF